MTAKYTSENRTADSTKTTSRKYLSMYNTEKLLLFIFNKKNRHHRKEPSPGKVNKAESLLTKKSENLQNKFSGV